MSGVISKSTPSFETAKGKTAIIGTNADGKKPGKSGFASAKVLANSAVVGASGVDGKMPGRSGKDNATAVVGASGGTHMKHPAMKMTPKSTKM